MFQAKSAGNQVQWKGGGGSKIKKNSLKHIKVLELWLW